MGKYKVAGTLQLAVEMDVIADSELDAIQKELVNRFNLMIRELFVQTDNGSVHKLKVNDVESVDWEYAEEVEEIFDKKEESTKRGA